MFHSVSVLNNHYTSMKMIHIRGGAFAMGSEGFGEFESPVRTVTLSDFLLDETLVTNAAFGEFTAATGYVTTAERTGAAWGYDKGTYKSIAGLNWKHYALPGRADHPVVLVSWHDAAAYCQWAHKRLPTEAEWEYAARGGNTSNLYPWGGDEPDGTQSNFARAAGAVPPTTPVMHYPPSPLGLRDLVGNAWQWCSDWFGETYYATGDAVDPAGPSAGQTRVRRGGSWNVIQPFRLRCSNRGAMLPDACAPNVGFRCAQSLR